MNTQREQLIQTWITTVLNSDEFELNFLAGDASFRRYARIKYQNKSYMLMDAPPEKEDCAPFVHIDEFLLLMECGCRRLLQKSGTGFYCWKILVMYCFLPC